MIRGHHIYIMIHILNIVQFIQLSYEQDNEHDDHVVCVRNHLIQWLDVLLERHIYCLYQTF